MGNEQIAREFLVALAADGPAALPRYTTGDLTWWCQGAGEIQDMLPEYLLKEAQAVDGELSMKVHATTTEGKRVALEAESYAKLKNGRVYNNRYHFLIEFAGGRIKSVKEYHDTKHASETWAGILDALD